MLVEFVRGKFVVMPASNQGSDCKDSPSNSLLVGGFSPTRLKNMHVRQIGSKTPIVGVKLNKLWFQPPPRLPES